MLRLPHYRSNRWVRWTTRRPTSPYTVQYLRNCHRAATYFIEEYLLPTASATRPSFDAMTRAMHLLTTDELHWIPIAGYDAVKMHPGRTRIELLRDPRTRSRITCESFIGRAVERAVAKVAPARRIDARGSVLFGGLRFKFHLRFQRGVSRLDVRGIPKKAKASILLPKSGTDTLLWVPSHDAAALESCYRVAEREMNRILSIQPAQTRRFATQRRRLFYALASYYRLMTQGHFFLTQNNSMLMNQLNCITHVHFGAACLHYNLDGLALMLREEDFARLHASLFQMAVNR